MLHVNNSLSGRICCCFLASRLTIVSLDNTVYKFLFIFFTQINVVLLFFIVVIIVWCFILIKLLYSYCMAGYFQGGNISRMLSCAIIHKEIFHESMALNNIATLKFFL